MKKISMFVVAFTAFVLTSCYKDRITGDGPLVTETRTHTNFSGIDLRVSGEVIFKQDSVYKVEVQAQQNILEVIETYISDNKLVIRFENDVRVRSHEPIRVTISAPSINKLRISGSGTIKSTGALTASSMEMDISGSGNIHLPELTTGYLDADISGSGNINIDGGTSTEEKLRISGSGGINLENVSANHVTTTTSGSGDMRVKVSQQLNVTISGSGNVYYTGNPIINTSISGSGKVIHF